MGIATGVQKLWENGVLRPASFLSFMFFCFNSPFFTDFGNKSPALYKQRGRGFLLFSQYLLGIGFAIIL
jgi:hypothetical protein